MTKEEIEAIVEAKFGELAQAAEAKLAEVEVEADEEDKKDEPKDTPAVMRAFGRLSKASKRLAAKLGAVAAENAELKAGLANAGDVAFARFTAALGQSNGEFKAAAAAKTENDPETAIMAAMQSLPAGKNTRGHAKAHLARTNPELYAKINQ